MMYAEPAADFGVDKDSFIYCAVNAHWEPHSLGLPIVPEGMKWSIVAYTGDSSLDGSTVTDRAELMPRSLMLLIAQKPSRRRKRK